MYLIPSTRTTISLLSHVSGHANGELAGFELFVATLHSQLLVRLHI